MYKITKKVVDTVLVFLWNGKSNSAKFVSAKWLHARLMSVGQIYVDKMPEGQMSVGQMYVDQ